MGHWCKICKRSRPNEKFSGKGHKTLICKQCQCKPKDEINAVQHEDEIFSFLNQSNISKLNIQRLKVLINSDNGKISELATIALEVAEIKPHKKRRLKFLAKENPDLLIKMEDTGLIYAHHY